MIEARRNKGTGSLAAAVTLSLDGAQANGIGAMPTGRRDHAVSANLKFGACAMPALWPTRAGDPGRRCTPTHGAVSLGGGAQTPRKRARLDVGGVFFS
jgi:hypothetical protein